MRTAILLALAIGGCTTYQFDGSAAVIGVGPSAGTCLSQKDVPLPIAIRNTGSTSLRMYVEPASKRQPYKLSWLSYDVVDAQGNSANGPGGHGSLPQAEIILAPGDQVTAIATLYDIDASDRHAPRRLKITDLNRRQHISPLFTACG